MKKKYAFLLLTCFILFFSPAFYSQDWVKMMKDPQANFYEVQKTYRASSDQYVAKYRQANGVDPVKIPGYKVFKRWENFMAPRVYPTGERFNPGIVYDEYLKYQKQYRIKNAGNWTFIGPKSSVPNGGGAGRANFLRVHPTVANTIYTGSPAGGLWKSVDDGANWTTNTDKLGVIGCTDLAIDPVNPNTMYLATGDGDANANYSIGILKSTDDGANWVQTGLSWNVAQGMTISKLLINPANTNIVLAATSAGVFRSVDKGANWTMVQSGSFQDMEFKPNDPNIVYTSGADFYKSTNAGAAWTKITSGLPPTANVSRIAIAVTAADPLLVYLIVGLPSPAFGTEGFYKSVNGGTNFVKQSTPNLGTQQWYDLCVAASPTDKNEILLGGQTQFLKSTNGGSAWAPVAGNTHVDYHDVIYYSASDCYLASDGGVWKSKDKGATWTDLSDGLYIAEMYGFGQSTSNAALTISGWQDNGTNLLDGNTWTHPLGGDGMLAFISWDDDQNMWGSTQNGGMYRSVNGGASFSPCGNIPGESGKWVTPWLQDPSNPGTIYAGLTNVWKSIDGGMAWTKISAITTGTLNAIAVSPASSQVIWAANTGTLYKTSNGGTSWTTITSLPSGYITSITCHNTDPNKAWITFSGYNSKNKVYQTNDQGVSWINLSNSLPNIPVNCIEYMNGSNDGVYVGTDLGVYYRDASLAVWQTFSDGLPNVIVTQIGIHYGSNKIRVSTYGRGLWESGFYIPGAYAPVANFNSLGNIACPGTAVKFSDQSSGPPTSWKWTFTGGNPATSTLQNPSVVYNTPGTYSVSMIASNATGSDTVIRSGHVTITTSPYSAPKVMGDSICSPGTVNLSATGSGVGQLRWWNSPGGGSIVKTGATYSPSLTSTTTFYVDEDFYAATEDYVGAPDKSIGGGSMFTANDIRGLYFDVLSPVILKSVDVYSNSAGNRTIEILDAFGTLMDTTVFIPASPSTLITVPLNFKIYPGSKYFIKCRGFVDLFRNSDGAVYPYTSSELNITNSNAGLGGYYYFFYNWVYTPITCNTSRVPVTGIIGCIGIKEDELTKGTFTVYPSPNNGVFDLSFTVNKKDNYTLKIFNTLGQTVYEEDIHNYSGIYSRKINIAGRGTGVYMISLSNSKNETLKKTIVY